MAERLTFCREHLDDLRRFLLREPRGFPGLCAVFVLPPVAPVDVSTFNYAPVAVLVVLVIAGVSWQVSGKKNFMAGPPVQEADPSPTTGGPGPRA